MSSGKELIVPGLPLATLRNCGGYYECPRDLEGNRLGPLVGYAGTYKGAGGQSLHYVGDVYVNFAKAEQYPWVLDALASNLANTFPDDLNFSVLLGAPMGGIFFTGALGFNTEARTIFAEKKVIALATKEGDREGSELVINRHELKGEDRVMIVEDVCNNFSTTQQLIVLVEKWGVKVVGICCFLNRSGKSGYLREDGKGEIPVFALEARPIQQWKQEDMEVSLDLTIGNVVWKPKSEWPRLMNAMDQIEDELPIEN